MPSLSTLSYIHDSRKAYSKISEKLDSLLVLVKNTNTGSLLQYRCVLSAFVGTHCICPTKRTEFTKVNHDAYQIQRGYFPQMARMCADGVHRAPRRNTQGAYGGCKRRAALVSMRIGVIWQSGSRQQPGNSVTLQRYQA